MFRLISLGCLLATSLLPGLGLAQNKLPIGNSCYFPRSFFVEPRPFQPTPARESKRETIEQRLLLPLPGLNFQDVPLRLAIDSLRSSSGINIVFDARPIEEAGINLDCPVTLRVKDISLKSALKLLLEKARLTYQIKHQTLYITVKEDDLHRLNAKIEGDLLEQMEPVAYDNITLLAAIQDITARTGFEFEFDTKALTNAGLSIGAPVKLRASHLSARSVLRLILDQNSMDYLPKAGRIIITSKEKLATEMVQRSYPIGDLLLSISVNTDEEYERFEALQKIIRYAVAPKSWRQIDPTNGENAGGEARLSVGCGDEGLTLEVQQNRFNHSRIELLLCLMRHTIPTHTVAEIRPFRIRKSAMGNVQTSLGMTFQENPDGSSPTGTTYTCLSPKQLRKFVEAACTEKGTTFGKAVTQTFASDTPVSSEHPLREEFVTGFETVIRSGKGCCVPKKEAFEFGKRSEIRFTGQPKNGNALIDFTWKTVEVAERRPFPVTIRVPQTTQGTLEFVDEQHILTKPRFRGATIEGLVSVPTGTTLVAIAPVRAVTQQKEKKEGLQTISWRPLTREELQTDKETTDYVGVLITVKKVGREGYSTKFLEDAGFFDQAEQADNGCPEEEAAVSEAPCVRGNVRFDVKGEDEKSEPLAPSVSYPGSSWMWIPPSANIPTPVWIADGITERITTEPDVSKTPIKGPLKGGETPKCDDPPDLATILRALPTPSRAVPYLYEESRDDYDYVIEVVNHQVFPPRFYPLVGPAQLCTCHYKCTVYYTETIEASFPFPFQTKRRTSEVVYIDRDHLHLVGAKPEAVPRPKSTPKPEIELPKEPEVRQEWMRFFPEPYVPGSCSHEFPRMGSFGLSGRPFRLAIGLKGL